MMVEHPPTYPAMADPDYDAWTLSMATALSNRPLAIFWCGLIRDDAGDGTPQGFLAVERQSRLFGTPREYICGHFLYIIPAMRRHGFAHALIDASTRWARRTSSDNTYVELTSAGLGDDWSRRGWTPYSVLYYIPFATLLLPQTGDYTPLTPSVVTLQSPVELREE
jgi:GNAT superfamily N-acetyltransferase